MAHRSRLAGFIIDCQTGDLDAAADFWSQALGCSIADRDAGDGTAEYQMLGDTPGDLHIEVQKVAHPSRVHLVLGGAVARVAVGDGAAQRPRPEVGGGVEVAGPAVDDETGESAAVGHRSLLGEAESAGGVERSETHRLAEDG